MLHMKNFNYDFAQDQDLNTMGNKLFCTFALKGDLDQTVKLIEKNYDILYGKIFILKTKEEDELVITYNVDFSNILKFPENTILVHRKKQVNTLYTINALNMLIVDLNGGVLDKNYKINWDNYKNTILLTKEGKLKKLETELFFIKKL